MATFRRLGLLACALLAAPLSFATENTTPRDIWHGAVEMQYAELSVASERLETSAVRFCQSPDEALRQRLENDWLSAYQAWQAVRFIQFGPVEQNSRGWQLQFWPDRKNLVGRKVNGWLKATSALDAQVIAGDSVAVQGFPALEYLLYDDAMDGQALSDPAACDLMQAITTHIADTTNALHRDWQAFGEHYLGTSDYTETTLASAIQALELLEDKRLGEPMGLKGAPANGYLSEAWRSGNSVRLVESSLEGLRTGFLPGLTALLREAEALPLAEAFRDQLDKTLAQARDQPSGLVLALDDEAAFRGLQSLYLDISQLRHLLGNEIAGELGLVRGFNSSDGD
ncbi:MULTISPECIES: imelysin family protein [unclassified Halomonas]|uniref:imelysin family protein n=1 Tax=unclassified Halomonas TaxID=2609666 RepID=UPI00055308B3|nr:MULTISPECIES: imelysin family protein [unclassified Halomonas]CEP37363.1 Peptidase M75, Imelysin [Halomonas sp. R57-5]